MSVANIHHSPMTELINLNKRTSVSIPRGLILEIDRTRGDVSRSRLLLRILERSRTSDIDAKEDE